jgi:hypothetical protein
VAVSLAAYASSYASSNYCAKSMGMYLNLLLGSASATRHVRRARDLACLRQGSELPISSGCTLGIA